jgi:LPS sulfotransferase NodH
MTTPMIVLATQRTGSSWVQEMLNSHSGVKVYSELFLAEARGRPMWEPSDVEFVNTYWERRARRPRRLTRHYWTVAYLRRLFDQPECEAVGFKYMYDQVRRSPLVLPYAAARRVRVVHLIRRNLLDALISSERALHTGIYHMANDQRAPIPWAPSTLDQSKIHLDPASVLAELTRRARERQRVRAWLRATRTPSLEVEYEALATDPRRFRPILEFLGVRRPDAGDLHSGLKKLATAPRADMVENFGELRAALVGTPFEPFLTAA